MVPFQVVKWMPDSAEAIVNANHGTHVESMEWMLHEFANANQIESGYGTGFHPLRKISIPFVAALHVGDRVFHPQCFQICSDHFIGEGKDRLAWDGLSGLWPTGAQCAACRIKTLPLNLDAKELETIICYLAQANYPDVAGTLAHHRRLMGRPETLTASEVQNLFSRLCNMAAGFKSLNESASRADKER